MVASPASGGDPPLYPTPAVPLEVFKSRPVADFSRDLWDP